MLRKYFRIDLRAVPSSLKKLPEEFFNTPITISIPSKKEDGTPRKEFPGSNDAVLLGFLEEWEEFNGRRRVKKCRGHILALGIVTEHIVETGETEEIHVTVLFKKVNIKPLEPNSRGGLQQWRKPFFKFDDDLVIRYDLPAYFEQYFPEYSFPPY